MTIGERARSDARLLKKLPGCSLAGGGEPAVEERGGAPVDEDEGADGRPPAVGLEAVGSGRPNSSYAPDSTNGYA